MLDHQSVIVVSQWEPFVLNGTVPMHVHLQTHVNTHTHTLVNFDLKLHGLRYMKDH